VIDFKKAKDARGSYGVDWSRMQDMDGAGMAPSRMERIPFSAGDARLVSIPADESIFTGVGRGDRLTHAVFALQIGGHAVHQAFTPSGMRQLADSLVRMADLIEGAGT